MSVPSIHESVPLVAAKVSRCLAAEVVTRTQLAGWLWLCLQSEAKTAKTLPFNAATVGAEGVRFGEGVSCFPMGRGLEIGLCPLFNFFYFLAQNGEIWCILGAIFYSSTACFTRKITELMQLKGEAAAWSAYSWIRACPNKLAYVQNIEQPFTLLQTYQ